MSEATAETGNREEPHIAMHSGEALTIVESREITQARETSLVVVVGSPDAGKTTLIASLFHCFQRGSFGGQIFAGSDTCVGLDRRCHLGRTISRGVEADMERTKVGVPNRLLHFRVRPQDLAKKACDLLITDISGEEYDDIRHSVPDCREFALFRRVDHLVVLVDGERLASPSEKHAAKVEVEQLMQMLLDAGHFESSPRVYLLVAKCDLMDEAAWRFAKLVKDDVVNRFSEHIRELFVGDIAARPKRETEEFPLGYGLSVPFKSWLTRPERRIDLVNQISEFHCHSEFDRFLLRQPVEGVEGGE